MNQRAHRWNHNIHYHRTVLDAVPTHARSALDVGTGNGLLAIDLAAIADLEVTGIDRDADVLHSARATEAEAGVETVTWVHDDVMTAPLRTGSFDVVGSVATLHHLPDPAAALHRFAELTAPAGVVVVVGLARTTRPRDVALHLAGMAQHRYLSVRRGLWEHSAPTVWPPPHSYAEMRSIAQRELPGARWRRLPMWRYSLVWHKPA